MNGRVDSNHRHHQKHPSTDNNDSMPAAVNRKKQKRRQKQAARLAAGHQDQNGYSSTDVAEGNDQKSAVDDLDAGDTRTFDDGSHDSPVPTDEGYDEGRDAMDPHYDLHLPSPSPSETAWRNNTPQHQNAMDTTTTKTKVNKLPRSSLDSRAFVAGTPSSIPAPPLSMSHPLPRLASHVSRLSARNFKKARSIWNTTTQQERENIKSFWLELGEDDRRQLVKVEKDAVLKKMKEQQRHSCSCTVCGRKRTAIEEELEVLYDAYYEELEQYANNNHSAFEKGAPIPPQLYSHAIRPPVHHVHTHGHFRPPRGRLQELPDRNNVEGAYYEDDEGDNKSYTEEDLEDDATRAARADFFAFGNSLTVKGNYYFL